MSQPNEAAAPLGNITVLDFGQVFQGPYASFLLAQAGANVIKIEPPNGEPLRHRAPPGVPVTLPFAMLNANKRAITLNLKSQGDGSCCSSWCGAPTCCWKILRPALWTISASAGTSFIRSIRG
jgi:crotonobetainyl-CoA:carnitine CoA-transferase CaiB-like acyl-CoA transferase